MQDGLKHGDRKEGDEQPTGSEEGAWELLCLWDGNPAGLAVCSVMKESLGGATGTSHLVAREPEHVAGLPPKLPKQEILPTLLADRTCLELGSRGQGER